MNLSPMLLISDLNIVYSDALDVPAVGLPAKSPGRPARENGKRERQERTARKEYRLPARKGGGGETHSIRHSGEMNRNLWVDEVEEERSEFMSALFSR